MNFNKSFKIKIYEKNNRGGVIKLRYLKKKSKENILRKIIQLFWRILFNKIKSIKKQKLLEITFNKKKEENNILKKYLLI